MAGVCRGPGRRSCGHRANVVTTKREPFAMTFEETVLTKLTAIENTLESIAPLQDRVASLETHRNFLGGIGATIITVAGWLHWRPL